MRYELKQNQGIPTPLLALMAIATGLSVANCYYNQPLLGSMARAFNVTDFSASIVATLTQIGYMAGLLFVIPLGDLLSRKKLILANYIISACALLSIAVSPNIYCIWIASFSQVRHPLCRNSSSRWYPIILLPYTKSATWVSSNPVFSSAFWGLVSSVDYWLTHGAGVLFISWQVSLCLAVS